MERSRGATRRTILRSWLAALAGWAHASAQPSGLDPVSLTLLGLAPATTFQVRYRMDATILLLGAPIFTREAAGGGYASVELSLDRSATALQFAAGSFPDRAHGLNRFGVLREAVLRRGDSVELSFAGLMTRSREESIDQGRKALAASDGGAEGVIARGRTTGSGSGTMIQTWLETVELGLGCNWSNLNDTLSDALRREPRTAPRQCSTGSAATFLYAMRAAALCEERQLRRQFLHAGKLYWLDTRRNTQNPLELEGRIFDLSGERRAEFKTSYAPGDASGIPIRIEYRPRSFLRLTFQIEREATRPLTQPPIPSVFPEENA
ncbi:MAG TPA: hypothetical protein VFW44_03620 [Bryobacteraceae bacterium]|nr:hypothetical protein [Bryobacteraceae bacterium]